MEISIPSISIIPEYFNAIRPLTKKEYSSLHDSIKEHGLRDQIVINLKGIVLDGHNRLKACNELGIKLGPDDFTIKQFDNLLEEKLYVDEVNLLRRQLTDAQRVEQVLKNKAYYENIARENMSKGGKGSQIRLPLESVNQHMADKVDVRLSKFKQIKYGLDNGSDDQRRKLLSGQLKPNKLYGDLRDEIDLKKRIDLNEKLQCDFLSSPDQCKLLTGDFREMSKQIESNSIPLIFTDPPYRDADIWMYEPAGKIANRILTPGGSLICYINQFKLFEIGDMLRKSLKPWSDFSIRLKGPKFPRHYDRQIVIKNKRLLWFVKGERPINPSFPNNKSSKRFMLEDSIDSTKPMKQFHKWGQSPVEAGYCIEHLTSINDQVVDLFLGEGTTAIASYESSKKIYWD